MLLILTQCDQLPQWNKSSDFVRTRVKIINSYRIHCDENNWHEIKYERITTSFFRLSVYIYCDTQTCLPTWIFVLSRIVPRPLAPVQIYHPRILIHLYSDVLILYFLYLVIYLSKIGYLFIYLFILAW